MKKRILSLLLVLAMSIMLLPITVFAALDTNEALPTEDGILQASSEFLSEITSPDPTATVITTAEELVAVKEGNFVLGTDIDLSTYNGNIWKPISLSGDIVFDGQGHIISNIDGYLFESDNNSMLIKNLGVTGASWGGLISSWKNYGYGEEILELTITNCFVEGSSNGLVSWLYNSSWSSGYTAYNAYSTVQISDCYVKGEVDSGGFIGTCYTHSSNGSRADEKSSLSISVSNSISYANVSSGTYKGGFTGYLE